jgi:hypothetical protein
MDAPLTNTITRAISATSLPFLGWMPTIVVSQISFLIHT